MEPSEQETTYESVLVRLSGDEDPRTELLWAIREDADRTYRLASNGLHCCLVIDDIVEVRRNAGGRLQVLGVLKRGGRPGWLIHLEQDPESERLIAAWRATGTAVHRDGWTVAVALDATRSAKARPTEAELLDLCEIGLVLGHLRTSDGYELTEDEAAWMDFRLQPKSSRTPEPPSVRVPDQRAG